MKSFNKVTAIVLLGIALIGIVILLLRSKKELEKEKPNYPIVYVSYDTPVEGYDVSITWYPTDKEPVEEGSDHVAEFGSADISFRNGGGKGFSINTYITIPEWFGKHPLVNDTEYLTLHYEPLSGEEILPKGNDQIIIFTDIDFDGREELIINMYRGGAQFSNSYEAYKIINGKAVLVDYPPFYGFDDWFQDYRLVFHPEDKTVECYRGTGVDQYSVIYQFDGTGNPPVKLE